MTQRLYYENAYLTDFSATVTSCTPAGTEGTFCVRLNQSAFYPTSGGQPYDTGTIDGAHVVDCIVEDGDVLHITDAPVEVNTTVTCRIDWARRFDHMQQHAADHMIAGALHKFHGGVTIGLHESDEVSTIDVAMPEGRTHLTAREIADIERFVNENIQNDVPIRCWFPTAEELDTLPLRKRPTVTEHVRVVAIGDYEMVACGGTHPSSAGQIGVVKILSTAPARGKMRLSFVAGMRALRDYCCVYTAAHDAAAALTTAVGNLTDSVKALQEENIALRKELTALKRAELLRKSADMLQSAETVNGCNVVAAILDNEAPLVRELCSKLIENKNTVALLGARNEKGVQYFFGRADGCPVSAGKLLKAAAAKTGGKGGGRDDFAQGSGPEDLLSAAKELLNNV